MHVEGRKWPRWLAWIVAVLAVWAVVALLLVLQLLPGTPKTTRGWILLLVVGPPVHAALEWVSSRLFSARAGKRISPARLSLARIVIALAIALVASAPFAWWFLRSAS